MGRLILKPDKPLTTKESTDTNRGQRDYWVDLTAELESGEILTGAGTSVKVVSSDATIVSVVSYQVNTAILDGAAIGKAVMMRLLAMDDSDDPAFLLDLEVVASSGTQDIYPFTLELVYGTTI